MQSMYKAINFGQSLAALTTVTAQLRNPDGTIPGTPPVSLITQVAGNIRNLGRGVYGAFVPYPDGFLGGYLDWNPGNGDGIISDEFNPPTVLAASLTSPTLIAVVNAGIAEIPIVDLVMGQGESRTWRIGVVGYDLTAWTDLLFTAKVGYDDPDPGIFQKKKGSGVVPNPAGAGTALADITTVPNDTLLFPIPTTPLRYDIKGLISPGVVKYLMRGKLKITPAVTQQSG